MTLCYFETKGQPNNWRQRQFKGRYCEGAATQAGPFWAIYSDSKFDILRHGVFGGGGTICCDGY